MLGSIREHLHFFVQMPENDESFVVKLTSATFNARINVSEVTLIIQANDAPVRFSQVGRCRRKNKKWPFVYLLCGIWEGSKLAFVSL